MSPGQSIPVVAWQRRRIPPTIAVVIRLVGGPRLAPQLRGKVTPRVVDALEQRGWHVHRIGSAAYVHAPDRSGHLILGVWPRRSPAPSWADRLGRVSAGYRRRLERVTLEQRWRRQARTNTGRFSVLRPWTRWPTPALYSWDPAGPSVVDQVDALERVNRWRAGLAGDVAELEYRSLDGDR